MPLSRHPIEALQELIENGDEADRCNAIRALGSLKAADAAERVIACLRDQDVDVCVDAAETLGKLCLPDTAAALIESLHNEPDGEVCTALVEALGNIGGEDAIRALHSLIAQRPENMEWNNSDWDPWWDVQLEAVKGLGRLRAEIAVDDLVRIIDDESEQDIESEILHALARMQRRGVDALITRLRDKTLRVQARYRAARALRHAPADNAEIAKKALGRALQDEAPGVRAEAAGALAALGATQYLRALLLMLRDPSEQVRHAALQSSLELGRHATADEELQEALLSLLVDSDSRVRGTLMGALVPLVGRTPMSEENRQAVSENLADGNAETAAAAASLLGYNADPAAVEPLLRTLQDRSGHPMVRREAALALGRLGQASTEVIDVLAACIGDRQQPVRLAALAALMELEKYAAPVDGGDADREATTRPLDFIIAAVRGKIELAPDRKEIIEQLQRNATAEPDTDALESDPPPRPVDYNPDVHRAMPQAASESISETTENAPPAPEPLPEVLGDYIQPPESPVLDLPGKAGRIVQAGEVRQAMSTLDAIAMDNVEVTLGLDEPDQEIEPDTETQEFLGVVDENIQTMKRLRSQRNITPEQDVRRLGARILAGSCSEAAIATLIQALNDEDSLLRREAADAIGLIGMHHPATPDLMDAVGTLVTQLTVGDVELRVTCARALGNLGNRVALAPLIEALNDVDTNVQVQSIGALAQLTLTGADPDESGHMVIQNIPAFSVARKLLEKLDSPEMAVRVAASRALGPIVNKVGDETFARNVATKIIDSVAKWSGEEARPLGQALRQFDLDFCAERLVSQLKCAESSLQRGVYIEILEMLLNSNPQQPQQAA